MTEEMKSQIRQLVAEILEMDVASIPDNALFVQDLGMDSLRALEILAIVEKKYKIQIPPERLPDMNNMTNVINIVEQYYNEEG